MYQVVFVLGDRKSRDDVIQDLNIDDMKQTLQLIDNRLEALESSKQELMMEKSEVQSMITFAKKRKLLHGKVNMDQPPANASPSGGPLADGSSSTSPTPTSASNKPSEQ